MSTGGQAVAVLNRGEATASVDLRVALGEIERAKDVWTNDSVDVTEIVSLGAHSAELLLVS
jgi:hypothetical protein